MTRKTQKGFVEYAIQQIKERFGVDLPNFGAVAGQSIAELYFEYYNYDIRTRIKDIDLFIVPQENQKDFLNKHIPNYVLMESKKWEITKYKTFLKESLIKNTPSSFLEESFDQNFIKNLKIKKINKAYNSIKIIYSTNSTLNNKLNITFYKNKNTKNKSSFTKTLISMFDINAVKIGINLESKKLYLDKDFKDFLKTRYVSIDHHNFKPSTIVRYFDKYGYYQNCVFNIEQELIKNYISEFYIGYVYSGATYNFHRFGFLEKRINNLNEKSQKAIKKYLKFNKIEKTIKQKKLHFTTIKELINIFKLQKKVLQEHDFIKINISPYLFTLLNYSEFQIIRDYMFFSMDLSNTLISDVKNIKDINVFEKIKNKIKNDEMFFKENFNENNLYIYSKIPTLRYRIIHKSYLRKFRKNILKIDSKNQNSFINHVNKNEKFIFSNTLLSEKIIDKINAYGLKEKNKYKFLEIISKSIYFHNDKSLININKKKILSLFRHFDLIQPFFEYYTFFNKEYGFKNIKEYFEKIAARIIYFENSNQIFYIGLFETNKIPLALFFKEDDFLFSYLKSMNFFVETPYIIKDFKEKEINGVIVNQLVSRIELLKEGQEMRHCIGGHSLKGGILHFSILNKNNNERSTFSAKLNENLNFNIYEIRNKFNKEPSLKNKKAAKHIVKLLNKHYLTSIIQKISEIEPEILNNV